MNPTHVGGLTPGAQVRQGLRATNRTAKGRERALGLDNELLAVDAEGADDLGMPRRDLAALVDTVSSDWDATRSWIKV